jgi:transposase InsO family protein
MEWVVKLFAVAFEQTCALKVAYKLAVNCLPRELTTAEVTAVLEKQKRLPKAFLSDHGSQFKEQWKEWCCERRVEVYFARLSYPQDKGEVERRVQNLNGEFVDHLGKFPEWLKGKLGEYKEWFNHRASTEE